MDSKIILTNPIYVKGRDCGYCHGKKSKRFALDNFQSDSESESITIGTQIEHMSCQDYDELVNMGFRRSGCFLYKTDMLRNCCRYYTIRTNLSLLELDKKHRQVINRFIKAILDEPIKESKKTVPFEIETLVDAELKSTRFHTRFETSDFTKEKFELYKKYQTQVHNDDPDSITEQLFKLFLCSNPFVMEKDGSKEQWQTLAKWKTPTYGENRLGPTHECYYLDGKIIAISIMDFLPSGISSVYFIWDPDYAHLSLGTLSGLRELMMVQRLALDYYYLGYYIEDCPKMVYKDKFGGELLDLSTEKYYSLRDIKPMIKDSHLFVMGDETPYQEIPLKFEYPTLGESTRNIAAELYRKEIMEAADEVSEKVFRKLKIQHTKFPNVIPGLMPMTQLLKVVEENDFEDNCVTAMFDSSTGHFEDLKPFKSMPEKQKQATINCLRIFGPKRLKKLLIIMY